jgi:hypothetical protein
MHGGEGGTQINFKLESHEEEEATASYKVDLKEMWRRPGSHFPRYILYLFLDYQLLRLYVSNCRIKEELIRYDADDSVCALNFKALPYYLGGMQ